MVARLGQGHRVCSKTLFKQPAVADISFSSTNAVMELDNLSFVSVTYRLCWSKGRKKVFGND